MAAITSGEIKIETAVPIEDLQDLHMDIQKDSHAVIELKGVISEKEGETALLKPMEAANLNVWTSEKLLFSGMIRDIQVIQEGQGYQVSIQGISKTAQIDYKKKNRTFQNVNKSYQEIMREALKDTVGAGIRFYASDRKIEMPLYQIEETDWEFIRRLASHLNTSIVPDVLSGGAEISIGLPAGRIHSKETLDAFREKVWFDRESRKTCLSIRSYEDIGLGDRVEWEGIRYTVIGKECQLEKGLLCFRYRIAPKEAFAAKPYENPETIGRLLSARVLETKDEQVKVKFDIDENQPAEEAYWYPWEPDAGNLMYCMPEKGEQIYIYLGDYFSRQARAVCGVHANGCGNPEMKTTDRYFTTINNKRMYLLPGKMGFQDLKQKSPLEMSLMDETGTDFISNRQIVISARDTIGIKGNNLFFQAPKEISIVRRDNVSPTVINMCNGFDSIGATNEVSMKGSDNAGFPVFHEYQQESGKEYILDGMEKDIIASTPCKTLTSGLEKQIRGIRVDQIGLEEADSKLIYEGGVKG
ncbi:MAG: hypothetical protein HDQ97_03760 [Lachnospiraceae bacterium]|nr:hypothetical protein [Lachnospiraceae bacterium]